MTDQITEDQLENLHPYVAALIQHFEDSEKDGGYALEDSEIAEIREGLEALYGDEELRMAVRGLLNLGATLQETGSPDASRQLFSLLAEPELLAALDVVKEARESEKMKTTATGQEKFAQFKGEDASKKAPQVGESQPEGAVKLDKIKFPRRL